VTYKQNAFYCHFIVEKQNGLISFIPSPARRVPSPRPDLLIFDILNAFAAVTVPRIAFAYQKVWWSKAMKYMKHTMPAHLVQTNQSGTKVRFPSVLNQTEGTLVVLPSGETMEVGSLLVRDRGVEKRELVMSADTGGTPVFPVFANGNVFH